VTLPTGNHRTLPQRHKGQQKENDKSSLGSDVLDLVVLSLSNHADPYFLT